MTSFFIVSVCLGLLVQNVDSDRQDPNQVPTLHFSQDDGSDFSFQTVVDEHSCDWSCFFCLNASAHYQANANRDLLRHFLHGQKLSPDISTNLMEEVEQMARDSWSGEHRKRSPCISAFVNVRKVVYKFLPEREYLQESPLWFIKLFNVETGAGTLLRSQWGEMISSGWSFFTSYFELSKKLQLVWEDDVSWPRECQQMDTIDDLNYMHAVNEFLNDGKVPPTEYTISMTYVSPPKCPIGRATVSLALAYSLVKDKEMFHGPLDDHTNIIQQLLNAAQQTVMDYVDEDESGHRWVDVFATHWPFWRLLAVLSCFDSSKPCAMRSGHKCYDVNNRRYVNCDNYYIRPKKRFTFLTCGEHEICTIDKEFDINHYCLPPKYFSSKVDGFKNYPFIRSITHDWEERLCTQCGQDGIIQGIFEMIGLSDLEQPYYVEFGARKPEMLNSAVLRKFCNWQGLLLDGQPGKTIHGGCENCPGQNLVQQEFVTAENINALFDKYSVPLEFDLLTIDTDFNDYWIWKAILEKGKYRPRLVAVDFNPDIPLHEAKTVHYEANGEWDGTKYTTASLLAYALLARQNGYEFVHALEMGVHAFFVRKDLLHPDDLNLPIRAVLKMSHKADSKNRDFYDLLTSSSMNVQQQNDEQHENVKQEEKIVQHNFENDVDILANVLAKHTT